jgi:hypothetical protein
VTIVKIGKEEVDVQELFAPFEGRYATIASDDAPNDALPLLDEAERVGGWKNYSVVFNVDLGCYWYFFRRELP